ncbi:MAG: DNA-binding protein [Thermodesulfobacteriota bacterium]
MKRLNLILALAAILVLLIATSAWSQPGMGQGGKGRMGQGGGMGMQYNPQTVETVSGEVAQVQQMQGRAGGVHLQLTTANETLIVVLGPSSFLQQQKVKIAAGDKLEIKGSRIQHPEMAMLLAAELKKGDQVVKLRDENGTPLWSRRGQRQQ